MSAGDLARLERLLGHLAGHTLDHGRELADCLSRLKESYPADLAALAARALEDVARANSSLEALLARIGERHHGP